MGGRLLTHAVQVITSNTSSSPAQAGTSLRTHGLWFRIPKTRDPAGAILRHASARNHAIIPSAPNGVGNRGTGGCGQGWRGASRPGQFVSRITVKVIDPVDVTVMINGFMPLIRQIVYGGSVVPGAGHVSVTVLPTSPGPGVSTTVNVAVSPGSTEVTFPGPPFVDVTVSVNGAPIVPVSVTLCGLPVAESTNCNTAVSSAVPNGVKIRFTTQELVGGVDGTVESPEQVVPLAMMVKSPGCGLLPVPA